MDTFLQSDPETVKKILSFCGNCPLAILSLCNSIRNSNITPDKLLLTFQMTQNETSAFDTFGVEACLKQSYERLDENLQQYLVMLFVFRTAKFDIDAASAIRGTTKNGGKRPPALIWYISKVDTSLRWHLRIFRQDAQSFIVFIP